MLSVLTDQEAGALVPYLLGRTAKETWSFAIDASAYGRQEQIRDVAKQKGVSPNQSNITPLLIAHVQAHGTFCLQFHYQHPVQLATLNWFAGLQAMYYRI